MITKEQTLAYDLETVRQRLDVRSLQGCVSLPVEYLPVLKAFFIAGYYFGYVNVIFYDDLKQNQFAKLADCTITAMARHERTVMVGSLEGQLNIYSFSASFSISKVESKFDHQAKVTDITVAPNQNLYCTCGEDSMIFLYNLFSRNSHDNLDRLLRCFDNPASGGKIGWVRISSSPLFCVIFYSPANKTVYSYSINGQYLNHVMDASDMFYPPFVQKDSNHTDTLVGRRLLQISINAAKTVQVWDLPFLDCRRKIQLKKNDTPRISCFECNPESTVAVVGTIEGHAYILMDPESY